jgi:hypothetical protein
MSNQTLINLDKNILSVLSRADLVETANQLKSDLSPADEYGFLRKLKFLIEEREKIIKTEAKEQIGDETGGCSGVWNGYKVKYSTRKTYTYSDELTALIEEVKKKKKIEELSGIAIILKELNLITLEIL